MTGRDFEKWLRVMGWSQRKCALELDLSRNTVAKYLVEGAPVTVGLACAAVAAGLPEWSPTE